MQPQEPQQPTNEVTEKKVSQKRKYTEDEAPQPSTSGLNTKRQRKASEEGEMKKPPNNATKNRNTTIKREHEETHGNEKPQYKKKKQNE